MPSQTMLARPPSPDSAGSGLRGGEGARFGEGEGPIAVSSHHMSASEHATGVASAQSASPSPQFVKPFSASYSMPSLSMPGVGSGESAGSGDGWASGEGSASGDGTGVEAGLGHGSSSISVGGRLGSHVDSGEGGGETEPPRASMSASRNWSTISNACRCSSSSTVKAA